MMVGWLWWEGGERDGCHLQDAQDGTFTRAHTRIRTHSTLTYEVLTNESLRYSDNMSDSLLTNSVDDLLATIVGADDDVLGYRWE